MIVGGNVSQRLKLRVILVSITFLVMMLSYQNCGGPPLTEVDNSSELEILSKGAPFAFDAAIDQISYMSCTKGEKKSNNLDPSVFYTLRAGAYEVGGIKVTKEFMDYAMESLPPPKGVKFPKDEQGNPIKKPTFTQIRDFLMETEKNRGAQLQFSIRDKNNIVGGLLTLGGRNGLEGEDYQNLFPILSTKEISDRLVRLEEGERLRYVDNGQVSISSRIFEATLYSTENEATAEDLRQALTKTAHFALTYTALEGVSGDIIARSPGQFELSSQDLGEESPTSQNQNPIFNASAGVYGRGYIPEFQQGDPGYSNNPSRVLRSLREVSLLKDGSVETATSQWFCPSELRLMIVSQDDAATVCPLVADDPKGLANREYAYSIIRNQLRVEDWYVNLDNSCVVPKRGECYSGEAPVQYQTDAECGPEKEKDCAHYVSFCLRE